MQHKVNFLTEFNRFKFRVFLFLDWLSYHSFIAGERIAECILFPKVFEFCVMQTALSRN